MANILKRTLEAFRRKLLNSIEFNAEDARKCYMKSNDRNFRALMTNIEFEAKYGAKATVTRRKLDDEQIKYLEMLGYTVTYKNNGCPYYEIRWLPDKK